MAETCYAKRINFEKLVLVFAKEVWENKRNIMIYSTLHTACLRGFLVVLQSPSLLTSLISLDFWTMNRRRILNGVCRPKFGPGPSRNVSRAVFLNCYLHLHRHLWSFEKTLGIRLHIYIARALRALGLDKRIDFWPQISKFSGQNCTFSSLAANWSRTGQCFQSGKGVSLVPWYEDTKSFTPSPQKNGFLAQKRPNLAQNWHFWPNIGIFGPFDLMPDQKTMRTSCPSGFPLCWYQNFYLLP